MSALPGVTAPPAIQRLAVIGAGVAGCRLAERAARAGYQVTLEDLFAGRRRIASSLLAGEARITIAAGIEDATRQADLVIDFVPDELESKLEILSLLDRMAPPHTIFATPIESLSIADLASCTYRSERCVGLRFSERLDARARVEILYPPQALPAVLHSVAAFWQSLGSQISLSRDEAALP